MHKYTFILLIQICCFTKSFSQQSFTELQKFSEISLFDLSDTTCFNVSGEWTGEEVQYDATQSYIKVKFKVVFKLKQEGNRVYGTSFIQDKYRGSYGDMTIRGMVVGNKLHFEEYEIVNEKFFEKNVVWCLRSGEMTIKVVDNTATLEGLSYNGYASVDYSTCTDYARMAVSKKIESKKVIGNSEKENPAKPQIEMLVYPNPCIDNTVISYELFENTKTRIDIFNLSGAFVGALLKDEEGMAGKHQVSFNTSAYAPGIYLVRLMAGSTFITKQIVKTR